MAVRVCSFQDLQRVCSVAINSLMDPMKPMEFARIANLLSMACNAAREAREALDETIPDAIVELARATEDAAMRTFQAWHTAGIPIAGADHEERGVQRTAVADRCASCQLPAHLTDVPNTMEEHPEIGRACFACRDTHDTKAKILAMLSKAPSCQLNMTSMARKLGRTPLSIGRACSQLSHEKLIERPYKNAHEKPSATTYRLTDAGSRAHFANIERKEQRNHV